MSDYDLSISNVSVSYKGHRVLDSVSIDVPAGEFLAVIGPNGAGKSSLLKSIVGVVAGSGEISVTHGGSTIVDQHALAKLIAYVPQQPMLPLGMTVAEYVLLGRTSHLSWLGLETRSDRRRVSTALERLDLAPFAGRELQHLSGGEAQRVTLARAIVQEAQIVVLDEPTSALDLGHQVAVLDLIDDLRNERGLTVVAALHDLTSAARYADRVLLLNTGRVAECGPPGDVITEPILSLNYGANIGVLTAPDGSLVVVPLSTKELHVR